MQEINSEHNERHDTRESGPMPPLWDYLESATKPIVLYGTGDGADKILSLMESRGLKPSAFMVSDEFARGQVFRGFEVKRLADIKKQFRDFIVLVCFGTDRPAVLTRITELAQDYELYAPDVPLNGDGIYDGDYIDNYGEKLFKARSLLADEKSREVFDGWLNYRLSGRIDILEDIATSRSDDISLLRIRGGENEVFIDVGGCKGDTVDEFIQLTSNNFQKIIAIEPDPKNYIWLQRRFYAYGSAIFVPVNAAAWSGDETLSFAAKTGRGGSLFGGGELDKSKSRSKQIEIKAVKIDTLCGSTPDIITKPTYIKIDAEGSEAEVIKGAKGVITKYKPKMSVSVYHRAEDMFALPLLLHSLNSKYKMYLRKSRCIPGWEFNLYVI